jgi:regulator of protease activity HflC (stomatin/prohibitin superfamily)
MSIAIVGIAFLLLAHNLKKVNSPLSERAGLIRIIGIVVVVFGVLSKCVVQIDAGKVGVQLIFGNVKKETLSVV